MPIDNYNRELAETVTKMFSDGQIDPRAEEIADFHFEHRAVGGEIIDGIRKRLPTILRLIEEIYELPASLVSEKYYVRFRGRFQNELLPLPLTEAEARKCIPVGHGVRTEGIRLSSGENDLIYKAAVEQGLSTGVGKVAAGITRTKKALEDGRFPQDQVERMAANAREKAAIPSKAEIGRIAHHAPKRKNGK